MTKLHSITFEKVNLKDNGVEGTKEYHIIYLVHSKTTTGLFEIKKHTPFLKEKTTSITFDFFTRIVGYSTDVPILMICSGKNGMILMPNHTGELVFLPPDGYLPDSIPSPTSDDSREFQKIIGINLCRTMQFLTLPEMLE